jgi:type 1 glutamine amidotransferase
MKHEVWVALADLVLAALVLGPVDARAATADAADSHPVIDCPLRDQPYSVDTPLIDLLLKPEARAILQQEMPGTVEKMPTSFERPPSFAAILTLRNSFGTPPLPEEQLAQIDRKLEQLPVTQADRQARCARYDIDTPELKIPEARPRILVFEKITGFRDSASVAAADAALTDMAQHKGWGIVFTDKGGANTPAILREFDAVVWNNVSGDALTLTQRKSLRRYIENGGGFVGIHGAGGDPIYLWDWYADQLVAARFKAHPMNPQFQDARVVVDDPHDAIVRDLAPGWTMKEEWYSFKNNPRAAGVHVLATLDESSYSPVFARPGMPSQDLRMGDHPIAWTHCVGEGRAFYSAIGHRPESYTEPHAVQLVENGIVWAANRGETVCRHGSERRRMAAGSFYRGERHGDRGGGGSGIPAGALP